MSRKSKGWSNDLIAKLKNKFYTVFDTKVKQVWAVIIAAAVLVFLLVLAIVKLGGAGTVVVDESFENYNRMQYSVDAYRKDVSTVVVPAAGEGVNGTSCLKIVSPTQNDVRLTRTIVLTEGKVYRIRADVKAEVSDAPKTANVSILEARDGDYVYVSNSDSWTHVDQYVKVGKTDSYTLCMRLGYFSSEVSGTAWFDNVSVTQVASAPAGARLTEIKSSNSGTVTADAKYNESVYYNMRVVSWLLLSLIFFVLLVYGLYIRVYDKIGAEYIPSGAGIRFIPKRYTFEGDSPLKSLANPVCAFVIVFALAFILRMVLSFAYFECSIDVNLFKSWGRVAAENGMSQLYVIATNCDYPPLYMYVLAFMTHIGNFLKVSAEGMSVLVKLPSILADIAIGVIVYFAAIKKRYTFGNAIFFASIWLFNPVVLIDAACWGQVDSILALFVILCCIALNSRYYLAAGVFFGLGTMLKPQMIIFLPVLGVVFFADFVIKCVRGKTSTAFIYLGKLVGGLFAGLFVPCIPFLGMGTAELGLFGKPVKLPWIFSLFMGTVDHYSYATVNNYNFWFLLGKNWVKDSETAGSMTLHSWGMLAIVAISLTVVIIYLAKAFRQIPSIKKQRRRSSDELRKLFHPGLVFLAGAAMFAMVSCFGPRMHERYFFPAVPLLLLAAICYHRKGMLGACGLMSGIGFITVHKIMLGLLVGGSIKEVKNDSSVYGVFYWPKLDQYRGFLAAITVIAALVAFGLLIANGQLEKGEFDHELTELEKSGRVIASGGEVMPQAGRTEVKAQAPAAAANENDGKDNSKAVKDNKKRK
ncbi:MAG: hypothetical protein J6112_07095 [Clostridia bacterium]|nr:hypothetical protein [Clostridia bacterium]